LPQASTVEKDYLKDGFVARSRSDEVPAPGYECWITRSAVDVSGAFASALAEADPLARDAAVRGASQAQAKAAEEALPAGGGGMRCEVQTMWPGKTYVLFTYERLRDVRLAYVPPLSLGNFGGDVDNFEVRGVP
jgi:hypothetical protein